MRELDASEIVLLIDTAASLQEIATREIKKVPALRGKTIVNLFYEPSTRTRTSFEIAGKWLSADVINFSASGSSTTKGESFIDTAKNIAAMSPDVVIVRHSSAGAAELLARTLPCSIVNAGDGAHEHPTQALLDLLTIREKKAHFDGLHVAIAGDVAHSRVARSDIHGMRKLGMTVPVAGPPTLIPPFVPELGAQVSYRAEDAIRDVDAIMMLRLQHDRMTNRLIPSLRASTWASPATTTRSPLRRARARRRRVGSPRSRAWRTRVPSTTTAPSPTTSSPRRGRTARCASIRSAPSRAASGARSSPSWRSSPRQAASPSRTTARA